jgi:hypothetical protein
MVGAIQLWLAAALVSAVMFAMATLLKKGRSYEVSGTANASAGVGEPNYVFYGVTFVSPPKLDLRKTQGYFDYKVTAQATDHFTILVKDTPQGPTPAQLRWVATGVLASISEPRSVWTRFNLGQKIFTISTLLTLIGLIADLIGIGVFISDHILHRSSN